MSTRGTYKIDGTLCYNHSDNYPSGAANHILQSIRKSGGVDLFSMIRGMERLEKGSSIYDGPAEYHYVIDSIAGTVKCYSIPFDKDELILESEGPLETWIWEKIKEGMRMHKAYYKNEDYFDAGETEEDYQVVKRFKNRFATLAMIRKDAEYNWKRGVELIEKGHTGNSSSSFQEALTLFGMVGNYEAKKAEWLNVYSPLFAEKYNHQTTKHFDSYITETIMEVV